MKKAEKKLKEKQLVNEVIELQKKAIENEKAQLEVWKKYLLLV